MLCVYAHAHKARWLGPAKTCAAACFVLPVEEVGAFNRRWRTHLLGCRFDVSRAVHWRDVAAAHETVGEAQEALAALSHLNEAIGFMVAIRQSTWNNLDSARRLFKTAEQFCLLRLMRLVLDRIEETNEPSPLVLTFERDLKSFGQLVRTVSQMYELDSRATDRVQKVAFSDPRADYLFSALDLVMHLSVAGCPTAEPPMPPTRFERHMTTEIWDDSFVENHWASFEWSLDQAQS
ncbi:MAG: hypothetical protein RLZ98_3440 [Pseudomonadota bacterium]|jgi:hypothetical protein